ncbi:hypothetical protein [Streptomyces scabiei]|uniref:hypothetical protein n=1 Tax=Streptomyces scabiei TaxID=1930 RepID=UPI000765E9EF|nr:hypothetical protein [Streptomyces scabiei]
MPTTGHGLAIDRPTRAPLNAAQAFGISVFPLLGALLALTGMPVRDILVLLSGCGAIGAATIALSSSRRRRGALAAALRAATGPDK